jgi:uncharacterized iron-regulated membrane protein
MTSQIKRQRRVRRWHRGIAMLASVQLLLWTLSGVYFSFVDIDYVRGYHYEVEASSALFDLSALQKLRLSGQQITIRERLPGELIIGVHSESGVRWRNVQGDALTYLSPAEALDLARQRTTLEPDVMEWVDRGASGSEYRGAPLPLWRAVSADSPADVAYFNASSGELVAVRHEAWRWWDFLWSLHIMSYSDRDTIGTWLLKCFSLLALGTAVMGVWLFIATSRFSGGQKNTRTQI